MVTMAFDGKTLPDVSSLTVSILGGTGDQGRGLGYRLARAGQNVLIGSRSADRAVAAAEEISAMPHASGRVGGAANADAAHNGDVAVIAVPWAGHAELVASLRDELAGKVVIDCVNPLGFDTQGPSYLHVPEGSAAQQAESLLPSSRVCAAFHHVSATLLVDPDIDQIELDVLVLGDDREAVAVAQALASRIDGMRGVYAGRLRNAAQVEALTANLIAINRRYKVHSGVRITNL
jgi:NADPH-dependent F420 reductase